MPVVLTGTSVRFEDVCTVEDAMEFIEYLRSNETPEVDLSACTYLHTALLQLLFHAHPRITAAPADPFLARWAGCGVTGPMQLYVDLDGRRVAGPLPADMRRTDSHSGYGYDITIPAKPGPRSVCVFAYSDKLLPCITVTVP